MIIQTVRLKSQLSEEELLAIARERAPQFRALEGLVQKYYVRLGEPGRFVGVYLWDSRESLEAFRESELAKSIPEAYQVIEAPDIEIGEVVFPLRG